MGCSPWGRKESGMTKQLTLGGMLLSASYHSVTNHPKIRDLKQLLLLFSKTYRLEGWLSYFC